MSIRKLRASLLGAGPLGRALPKVAAAAVAGLTLAALCGEPAFAISGQATPLQIGMQDPASPVAEQIHGFYNLVNIIIIAITAFVLILLLMVMVKFSEKNNPVPSKNSHNTALEVAWTVIPIFILIIIAIPSFKLLNLQYNYPKPDLTIKATGHAWYWTHEYSDMKDSAGKVVAFDSVVLQDDDRAALIRKGIPAPRLLATDNDVIVPVDKVVHVLVTADDVIHSWTVPAFGANTDAVPGRMTSTWFKATQTGIFYGDCTQLCGKDHSAMPISVRVVKQDVYDQWAAAMKAKDKKKAGEIIQKAALEQAGNRTVATAN